MAATLYTGDDSFGSLMIFFFVFAYSIKKRKGRDFFQRFISFLLGSDYFSFVANYVTKILGIIFM